MGIIIVRDVVGTGGDNLVVTCQYFEDIGFTLNFDVSVLLGDSLNQKKSKIETECMNQLAAQDYKRFIGVKWQYDG